MACALNEHSTLLHHGFYATRSCTFQMPEATLVLQTAKKDLCGCVFCIHTLLHGTIQ